MFFMKLLRYFC